MLHRPGLTPPPTPFLKNAVKDSPGRGWGKIVYGNRTVTHCRVNVSAFFPLSKGEMLSVFLFLFFFGWHGLFCFFSHFVVSKGCCSE